MTIQQHHEMTDAEITEIRIRADAFIEQVGVAISEAIDALDPESPCTFEARRGLARISATLRDADYVLLVNLATLDLALKRRTGSSLISIIETHLRAVGAGPSLDFQNADAFLAQFAPMVDAALELKRRRAN